MMGPGFCVNVTSHLRSLCHEGIRSSLKDLVPEYITYLDALL